MRKQEVNLSVEINGLTNFGYCEIMPGYLHSLRQLPNYLLRTLEERLPDIPIDLKDMQIIIKAISVKDD